MSALVPSLAQARDRLSEAVAYLDGRMSAFATMPEEAEHDIPAPGARSAAAMSFSSRTGHRQ
jgi:hypothetical protein